MLAEEQQLQILAVEQAMWAKVPYLLVQAVEQVMWAEEQQLSNTGRGASNVGRGATSASPGRGASNVGQGATSASPGRGASNVGRGATSANTGRGASNVGQGATSASPGRGASNVGRGATASNTGRGASNVGRGATSASPGRGASNVGRGATSASPGRGASNVGRGATSASPGRGASNVGRGAIAANTGRGASNVGRGAASASPSRGAVNVGRGATAANTGRGASNVGQGATSASPGRAGSNVGQGALAASTGRAASSASSGRGANSVGRGATIVTSTGGARGVGTDEARVDSGLNACNVVPKADIPTLDQETNADSRVSRSAIPSGNTGNGATTIGRDCGANDVGLIRELPTARKEASYVDRALRVSARAEERHPASALKAFPQNVSIENKSSRKRPSSSDKRDSENFGNEFPKGNSSKPAKPLEHFNNYTNNIPVKIDSSSDDRGFALKGTVPPVSNLNDISLQNKGSSSTSKENWRNDFPRGSPIPPIFSEPPPKLPRMDSLHSGREKPASPVPVYSSKLEVNYNSGSNYTNSKHFSSAMPKNVQSIGDSRKEKNPYVSGQRAGTWRSGVDKGAPDRLLGHDVLGPIDTRKRPPPVFSSQGPDTKKFKSGRNWPNDKTPYENAKNSSDPKNSQFLANPNLFTPPPNLQDSLNKSGSTLSKNNPHRSEDDTVSSAKFGSDKGTILNILEDPFGGRNPYSKHERPVSKAHIPEQNLKVDLSLPPPIALPKKTDPVPLSSVLIPPNLPFVKISNNLKVGVRLTQQIQELENTVMAVNILGMTLLWSMQEALGHLIPIL